MDRATLLFVLLSAVSLAAAQVALPSLPNGLPDSIQEVLPEAAQETLAEESSCIDDQGNGHEHGEFYGKDGVCEKYYECVYGEELEVNCPDDTAFDPAIASCNYIDLVPGCEHLNGITCTDVYCRDETGFTTTKYIDPMTCQAYQCSQGYSYEFRCAPGLVFNPDNGGFCDYEQNVEKCEPNELETCPGADKPQQKPATTTTTTTTTTTEATTTTAAPVPCPALSAPDHGSMTYVDVAPRNEADSIVEFACDDYYELDGKISVICLPDGTWSAAVPTCTPSDCGKCCQYDEDEDTTDDMQYKSCKEIKASQTDASNGIYTIYSESGEAYTTYCEMETSDGGWTLVASIHENDMDGKCTEGDKWSSEDGVVERHGNTLWDNDQIYGSAEAATSDDYKNKGYFELDAEQLMIIQVPNDEPTDKYVTSASFQYTTEAFLQEYGGNLQGLFKAFPIMDRTLDAEKDDGPAVEINFVKGSARAAFKQYGYDMQDEMSSGYMQFRAINKEHGATAFCPYGKMKGGWASSSSTEHGCFAATVADVSACGDFSAFDGIFNDIGMLNNWATDREMRKSAFLILYR